MDKITAIIDLLSLRRRGYKPIDNGPIPYIQFLEVLLLGLFAMVLIGISVSLVSNNGNFFLYDYRAYIAIVALCSYILYDINIKKSKTKSPQVLLFISIISTSISIPLFFIPKIQIIIKELLSIRYNQMVIDFLKSLLNNTIIVSNSAEILFWMVVFIGLSKFFMLNLKFKYIVYTEYELLAHTGEIIKCSNLYVKDNEYCIVFEKTNGLEKVLIGKENIKKVTIIEKTRY